MLTPSNTLPDRVDIVKAHIEYLIERGSNKTEAQRIAEWLENNKEKLASMQSNEFLQALREVLKEQKI